MSAPSVNQLPPQAPPPAPVATPTQATPGIVSVNARGGRAGHPAARAAFVVGIFALLALGSVYGVSKWREREKVRQAAAAESAKAENKPALVSRRRQFISDPADPPRVPAIEKIEAAVPPAPLPAPIPVARQSGPPAPSRYGGEIIVPTKDGAAGWVRTAAAGPAGTLDPLRGPQPGFGPAIGAMPGMLPVGAPAGVDRPAPARLPIQLAQAPTEADAEPSGRPAHLAPGGAGMPPAASPGRGGGELPDTQGRIGGLLRADPTAPVQATMLGDRNFILPKGRTIDCSLATRVVNEVSGMAECVVTSDVYSDNGRVLLLERGSQATGEYVATMAQGQRRLFLLWTRVRTPNGVVINLASPASDALGTAGLPGYVDNRWSDRIGAAVLLSLVQDAIGYATANVVSQNGGGASVGLYAFQNTRSTGERMVNQILQQTIAIKPTLYKNQGDRASIYVARDLDFGSVYQLTNR
jgi:type IV secretion system protein VirB10